MLQFFLVAVFYGPNVITQTDQYNLILPTLISILTRLYNNNINEDDVGYIYHHTLRKVVECKTKNSSTLQLLSFKFSISKYSFSSFDNDRG